MIVDRTADRRWLEKKRSAWPCETQGRQRFDRPFVAHLDLCLSLFLLLRQNPFVPELSAFFFDDFDGEFDENDFDDDFDEDYEDISDEEFEDMGDIDENDFDDLPIPDEEFDLDDEDDPFDDFDVLDPDDNAFDDSGPSNEQ